MLQANYEKTHRKKIVGNDADTVKSREIKI